MIDIGDDEEPLGPPLTQEEIEDAQSRLACWQPSQIFSDDTKALCNRCLSSDYFQQPRLKFLHDAYVVAKFAGLRGVDQVRLAARHENWPDGFVKIQNSTFNIEVTSTHGGRKLGDEYRHVGRWRFDPVEDWVARADSIPKYLEETIARKVEKKYADPCWLVVYLNIDEWGIRQKQIEQVILDTKTKHVERFADLTVIWKGQLY
ncbi:hypothetical protein [Bradyrhizobium sp.]|uniref:hypothetical protein n=1 Tax=Bradyrhizobium sp. TaxID=376 RepID=UPI003C747FA8